MNSFVHAVVLYKITNESRIDLRSFFLCMSSTSGLKLQVVSIQQQANRIWSKCTNQSKIFTAGEEEKE